MRRISLFLALALWSSNASAQGCTGQPAAGNVCANATASPAIPSWNTLSDVIDRNFGAPSPQGSILVRGLTLWGVVQPSTAAEYLAGTAKKIIEADVIYQAETVTTFGSTTTFDFSTFINTAVTLTGDITTQTVIAQAGKAGTITYIQDNIGGHTTVWNPIFKFEGGITPTLSTAAGAVDVQPYSCRSATFCVASLIKDVK